MEEALDSGHCRQYTCNKNTKSRKKRISRRETTSVWAEVESSLSVHGVRRVKPGKRSAFCSFLWSLILTSALAVLGFTIYERVSHFLMFDTSWRVSRTSNHEWPAITLCNINPLRVTKLFGNYLEKDTGKKLNLSWERFLEDNPYVTSQDVFLMNAHSNQDMIISCKAGPVACSSANFTMILTEQGLCHKLKPDSNADVIEVTLNIEVYEYILGLSDAGGIRVYVSEPQTSPIRDDTHFTVYPGHHFDVTLGREDSRFLTPPYGDCNEKAMDQKSCISECYRRSVQFHCHCRPFWFSDDSQDSPKCDIHTHFTCVKDRLDSEGSSCDCPMGCWSSVYSAQVHSYPRLFHPLEEFLDSSSMQTISQQYRKAKIIQRKVCQKNSTILQEFHGLYDDTVSHTEQFERDFHQAISDVREEYVDLPSRIHFHSNVGLQGLETTMKKGFLTFWRGLEQGELHRIQSTYQIVITTFNKIVNRFRFNTAIEFNLAKLLFTPIDMQLSVDIDMAAETLANITSLYNDLIEGNPVRQFEVTPDKRYDRVLIPCQTLTSNTKSVEKYYNDLSSSLGSYINDIMELKVVLKGVLITKQYNETVYLAVKENFVKHSQEILAAAQVFKEEIITHCEGHIHEKLQLMHNLNQDLRDHIDVYQNKVKYASNVIDLVKEKIFGNLEHFTADCNDSTTNNEFDDRFIRTLNHNIDVLIFELRISQHDLLSPMKALQESITSVWQIMFSEDLLQNFYMMLNDDVMQMISNPDQAAYFMAIFNSDKMLNRLGQNNTGLALDRLLVLLNADVPLKDFNTKASHVEEMFSNMLNTTYTSRNIVRLLQELRVVLQKLSDEFQGDNLGEELNKTFVKENLLSMRVTRQSESFLQWTQYPAYTLDTLLAEVGSFMVIFLGASVLSLLELCDICLSGAANKLCIHEQEQDTDKIPEKWDEVKTKDSKLHNIDEINSHMNLYRKSYVTFKDFNNVNGSEV